MPSDRSCSEHPAAMTESDTLRESCRHSDNLPKHPAESDFEQIVDGHPKPRRAGAR
ncbi:hypothetical protein K6Y32_31400 [Burkholderia cenocepacia]|nr:hypothetical protein [Burkholderia cenocepacia]MCW5191708.1 hypothetical protein [Burkholderia cenocepacia]